MAALFFDASALAKRYLSESGTQWVQQLTAPTSGNTTFVFRITAVEIVSAVSRRMRAGDLTQTDAAKALADLRYDFALQLRVIDPNAAVFERAEGLVMRHYLRAYDAMQLSAVLFLNEQRSVAALPPAMLVSADVELNAAAENEGVAVEDPNTHDFSG